MNYNCNCCGVTRIHKSANWNKCLGAKRPYCPIFKINKNNVLSPKPNQQSKYVRNAGLVRTASNNRSHTWKKVNWKRFQLSRQTKQYQTKIIARTTNNLSGVVLRNGIIINVAPTLENPCGSYTTDPTKSNIPTTRISNCCPNSNSNLTIDEINTMLLTEVNTRLDIDPNSEITCKSENIPSNRLLPVNECPRVSEWEKSYC